MKSLWSYLPVAALGALVTLVALPSPLPAQLLPDQRVFDFQNLVALYAKRYAPYDWKRQALGFDLFDIKPWLDRVRTARDDLEFFEIEAEYVANLQDTHAGFQMTSSFRANLGITVDIYDGKVLIDSINRAALPPADFPFQIGDEVVSVDSVSAEDWIKRISTWRRYGNPVSTRRLAAAQITSRSQPTFPRAVEIGESAVVDIRRASGDRERYNIPWMKFGLPVTTVGPVPFPKAVVSSLRRPEQEQADDASLPDELHHNYKLPDWDVTRSYVNGIGSPIPIFRGGFPSNFMQRLGRMPNEFHFSGTYESNGFNLGYLRIPSFSPANLSAAVNELRTEIDFLEKNTDGLIVDVMRNPGGGCYMIDAAAALTPYPFYFFGELIRATQDRLNSFQALLEGARSGGNDSLIAAYQLFVDKMKAALKANRGVTDPIAACRQFGQSGPPVTENNAPASVVYTKPIIILIDEFSISAADIFPSMMQDNGRALLVGARSSGGGGSVSGWPTGFYSESISANTNTLVVRRNPIVTSEYPPAPFVENIGARPDIPLNYMTTDNLVRGGRPFVNRFSEILAEQIRIAASEIPFEISDNGGVSSATPGASGRSLVGYARVKADGGSAAPSGLAIIGFRQNNTLVSETGIPATPAIRSGRVYAEIDGSVNTAVAIANPNYVPATVSFYFTGPNGNTGSGSVTVAANGQIAAFLDQVPFNGAKPLAGTFTFSSNMPIAVTALRGLSNERGEFLLTALPIADTPATPATGVVAVPHFADGDGWATQIGLVNPTDAALTGAIQFLDQAGRAVTLTVDGQTSSTFNYSIPARASQKFRTSGLQRSVLVGTVRVMPAGAGARPSAFAVYVLRKNGVTVAEAGAGAPGAGSAFRLYAEAAGDFDGAASGAIQTGLAISNLSAAAAMVSLELNGLDGTSTGLTGSILVPANGQVANFLNQIPGFASLPRPFQGVLRISSASSISVVGLRGRYNERSDFLITTIPPVNEEAGDAAAGSGPRGELFFPHFVEAGGYTTQFILFSGSAGRQSSGTLRFVSQSGEVLNLTLR